MVSTPPEFWSVAFGLVQVSEHFFTLSLSHTHLHLPAAHALCHVHDARHHEQTSSCPGKDLRPTCILGHVNSHKVYIAWSSHIALILSGILSSLRTWAPIKRGMYDYLMDASVCMEMLRKVEPLDNFFCPVNAGDPPPDTSGQRHSPLPNAKKLVSRVNFSNLSFGVSSSWPGLTLLELAPHAKAWSQNLGDNRQE